MSSEEPPVSQEFSEANPFIVDPLHQPDWAEWRATHNAPINHIVFLSINICPLTALGLSRHGDIPGQEKLHDVELYPNYFLRLRAVLNHIEGGSSSFHPIRVDPLSPERTTISFEEFVEFARDHDWPLPESFPGARIVSKSSHPNRAHRWPWGDYTTERLEIFSKAVHQFWSDYDRNDPDAAPKNEEIEAFLEQEGISEKSQRQAMCALMRHESAPSGRRKKPQTESRS